MATDKIPARFEALDHSLLSRFADWIERNGGVIRDLTSEWEVVRYMTGKHAHIVYRTKGGSLTWGGWTAQHYSEFLADAPMTIPPEPANGEHPFQPKAWR